MAGARLMRVDKTSAASLVVCRCGFRQIVVNPARVRPLMDAHRATAHPVQAATLAAQRQARRRPVIL